MKKFVSFILIMVMIVACVSCKNGNSTDNSEDNASDDVFFKIESYSWVMNTVQSIEKEGQIVACSSNYGNIPENASIIDLRCKANDGKFVIEDVTNDKVYTGTYKVTEKSFGSTYYEISVEGKNGKGVVSVTYLESSDPKTTLIMRFDDYTVNFFEQVR